MIRRNMVVLTGRATRKAELKDVGNSKVCTIRMVSNKRIKGRDGEWTEKPMYIDAECWGPRAEYAAKYIDKGSVISVTGELEQDEWGEGENKRQKHKIYVSFDLQVDRFADSDRKGSSGGDGNSSPGDSDSDGDGDLPF